MKVRGLRPLRLWLIGRDTFVGTLKNLNKLYRNFSDCLDDPLWGTLQSQITPLFNCLPAVGFLCLCGERGIRTPGSPEGEQRFSRPPHSTTLPSLLILLSRIHHGVYPDSSGPSLLILLSRIHHGVYPDSSGPSLLIL
jgi:hypothetical protein